MDRRLVQGPHGQPLVLPRCADALGAGNASAFFERAVSFSKRSFCQDRLEANTGRFETKGICFLQATVLAAGTHGSSEFSGYIVPRSGGQQAGGLLRRAIALAGSGAKALRYFKFGPEYTSPSNCYSESADIDSLFSEMRLAHAMIASAESVLWEARRPRSQVRELFAGPPVMHSDEQKRSLNSNKDPGSYITGCDSNAALIWLLG